LAEEALGRPAPELITVFRQSKPVPEGGKSQKASRENPKKHQGNRSFAGFAIAKHGRLCSFPSVMANPTNVLSTGIEITGSIRFSNDMIIDGKVEGEITSDKGRVTIGENASIKGDVTAGDVKVYGRVEGKITSERCELKNKSRINGDIKSKVFSMEEGAQLSGRTEIGG
jgi:cytoskeletal protein CcmA (bactofilin family)